MIPALKYRIHEHLTLQGDFEWHRPTMRAFNNNPKVLVSRVMGEVNEMLDALAWGDHEPTDEEILQVASEIADIAIYADTYVNHFIPQDRFIKSFHTHVESAIADGMYNAEDVADSIKHTANKLESLLQQFNTYLISDQVEQEIVEIMHGCYDLAEMLGIDLDEAIVSKIAENNRRFPKYKFQRGSFEKSYFEIKFMREGGMSFDKVPQYLHGWLREKVL